MAASGINAERKPKRHNVVLFISTNITLFIDKKKGFRRNGTPLQTAFDRLEAVIYTATYIVAAEADAKAVVVAGHIVFISSISDESKMSDK